MQLSESWYLRTAEFVHCVLKCTDEVLNGGSNKHDNGEMWTRLSAALLTLFPQVNFSYNIRLRCLKLYAQCLKSFYACYLESARENSIYILQYLSWPEINRLQKRKET